MLNYETRNKNVGTGQEVFAIADSVFGRAGRPATRGSWQLTPSTVDKAAMHKPDDACNSAFSACSVGLPTIVIDSIAHYIREQLTYYIRTCRIESLPSGSCPTMDVRMTPAGGESKWD